MGQSCRSGGWCPARARPGSDRARSWTGIARVVAGVAAPPRHAPRRVRWSVPAGLDRSRHGAGPTGLPTIRTGLEGSQPVGPVTPKSVLRARQMSSLVTRSVHAIAAAPTDRHGRLRHVGPPTYAPIESCVPAPRRSRSGSLPPTGDAPLPPATPALTHRLPCSTTSSKRTGTMSLRNPTSPSGTITCRSQRNDLLAALM